ncbi:MAG: DedA family protein [Kordiimonas sp.]
MESITQTMIEWLQYVSHDPLLLAFALAVATFVTEDGALIAGSLLVGSGEANPVLAIAALATGITVGDVGLYFLGWSARTNQFLRSKLPVKKSRPLRRWLLERETPVLFTSRFTPGTRLITYVTFGFLKLSLIRFVTVMTISGILWVTSMVLFVSEIQKISAQLGTIPSIALAVATGVLFIFAIPKILKKVATSETIHDAKA